MKKVMMLHSVNHNMYGKRDPEQYGTITLDEINQLIEKTAKEEGIIVDNFQTNHEGEMVDKIHSMIVEKTGKQVEVMIYGDGAFKDPVGKIWELADPVVSPAYTAGLEGTPNEVKLKYLADNDFAELSGEQLKEAIKGYIKEKDDKASSLKGTMVTQGTTPRQLTDLIGSLADLTSGSGDKGTPIIYVQGYFDNYTK